VIGFRPLDVFAGLPNETSIPAGYTWQKHKCGGITILTISPPIKKPEKIQQHE
jgi:hypothetical protein